MTILTIDIPWPEVLNTNQRLHWAVKAQRTKSIRYRGYIATQGSIPTDRAHLAIDIGWPDKRRRDAHNIMPTIKACIDGIVGDAQLLPDDSDEYLLSQTLTTHVAGIKGILRLRFEFVEVAG